MDQVEIIAVASACFGFGVGYLLAYKLTKGDLLRDITMRIEALRRVGSGLAGRDGTVPWSAIDKVLVKFPGQEGHRR